MNGLAATPHFRERRQRRRQLTGALPATLGRHPISVVDLSLGGLGFTTSERLHPFDRYRIRISTAHGELCASGHLVWCRIAETEITSSGEIEPIYRGGIRFEPLAAEDSELLLTLMKELGSDSSRCNAGQGQRLMSPAGHRASTS